MSTLTSHITRGRRKIGENCYNTRGGGLSVRIDSSYIVSTVMMMMICSHSCEDHSPFYKPRRKSPQSGLRRDSKKGIPALHLGCFGVSGAKGFPHLQLPRELQPEQRREMEFSMGLHFGQHAPCKHSVVLHSQLARHRSIPIGYLVSTAPLNPTLLNSCVIEGMVAMILLRTLHKDIARYNQIDSGEDAQEEFGWKLVHGDVFRPPRRGMMLAVLLGSGTQILCMTGITLVTTTQ